MNLLESGAFEARDGEGRVLYSGATVGIEEAGLTLLQGPSGSGKTTLLRQLVGLSPCGNCRRQLGGVDYSTKDLPRWRAEVTLLMQDAPMLPGTIEENLKFPCALKAAGKRTFDPARAETLLEEAGISGLALERPVATLSGGERHRLGLVRGLLWDPKVLVADEPLTGLGPDHVAACFSMLLRFARRPGHAALCVLHDPGLGGNADAKLNLTPRGPVRA